MRDRKRPRYELEEKERRGLLTKQPTVLLRHIGSFSSAKQDGEKPYGDSKTLAGLAHTSQRFYGIFQPAAQAEVDKILFNHIVHGEPDAVYAMLDKQPSLLLHIFTVTDYAGYTLKDRTPLQVALCCQDPQMAEEIQRRLIAHTGPDEAARQWDAQFPASWEEAEKERWKLVFAQLKSLDAAIRAAEEKDISADPNDRFKPLVSEGSAVETELKEFQRLLDATRDKPIETGRTFNPHFLQELANCYADYIDNFEFDNPKSLLFWQRIFGYAQGFLSAPDAQAFVEELETTTGKLENKIPQDRNLEIDTWDPISGNLTGRAVFYSCAGLGVDYGISAWGMQTLEWVDCDVFVGNFLSAKNKCFSETYAATSRFKPSAS